MPLSPGTKLASYEIVELVGRGGMGEVYRARDTKLGRDVAIKVLPEEFARDKDRLDRLEREARLLAQLNHPNIATLHGLEEHDGQRVLVMELVEGETLAERIAQGPIPVDEAIPLFIQIAEGLEAAHEKGIIHRDLKPANIKIDSNGKPKILDFGLAKAFVGDTEATSDSSQSPTLTKGTALGVIMGTAAYMSPEQARGTAADRRTDVWAFGCCLFEVLTGKRAFEGEHVTDILAAVMRAQPDWSLLGSLHVRRIAERCLRKDRKQRFQHIGDVRIALQEPLPSEAPTPAKRLLAPILLTTIATAGVTALFSSVIDRTHTSGVGTMELTIQLPADRRLHTRWDQPPLALTPDGGRLVFLGGRGERRQIYVREMSDKTVRPVDGTEGAEETALFVSPDGEWVGFYRDETLWKTRINGGIPVSILESSDRIEGARWPESDTIFFRRGLTSPLYRISADGGEPEALSEVDPDFNEWHASPRLLPSGDALLFTSSVGSFESSRIDVLSLSSGKRKRVLEDVFFVEYATSGHLIYGRNETLFAVPFDAARLEVTGPATPAVNGVLMDRGEYRGAYFTVSASGTLVYAPANEAVRNRLVWVDRAGETERLNLEPGQFRGPRLSPDGSKLLLRSWSGNETQVQLIDLRRNVAVPLATGADSNSFPVWSPDGERIVFQSNLAGPYNMFVMPADGSGRPERLLEAPNLQQPYSWSRDGEHLLYVEGYQQAKLSVLSMRSSGGEASSWLSISPTVMTITPRFSPDGRYVAFVSSESGRYEVYISAFDLDSEVRPRQKVSPSGGWEPVWSPDGGELYFRNADGTALMVVSVEFDDEMVMGEPRKLFDTPRMPAPIWYGGYFYDVAPDGRFLMVHETDEREQPMNLVVVLNWLEELERLVPTN